ncbi:21967_t:CDS:2, partial [Dentiscutata erythropus]
KFCTITKKNQKLPTPKCKYHKVFCGKTYTREKNSLKTKVHLGTPQTTAPKWHQMTKEMAKY